MLNPQHWAGRRCLVTGATGFLGGMIVRRLLELGAQVTTILRSDKPDSQFEREGLRPRCRIVPGSMTDAAVIAEAFAPGIDVVFHVGAMSDVLDAGERPAECLENNILSAIRLLEHVRTASPETVVVMSSSDKAYGPQAVPYKETQLLAPHHPYEVSKASQDMIAQCYGRLYGVKVAITRCANFFGPWDLNLKRIIPGTIVTILRGEPVQLRSDGKFTRDFLYIEDAVECKLLLAERLVDTPAVRGEPFNFSYEVDIEIIEIVRTICRLMDVDPTITVNDKAAAEIRYMAVDATKAKQMLNWQPMFRFDDALARTIDWYRGHFAGATS